MPPCSPNDDPISDQKNVIFSYLFSDLTAKKLCHHHLEGVNGVNRLATKGEKYY